MVKAHPGDPDSWWFAPRGLRSGGEWQFTLGERVFDANDGAYERAAVTWFSDVVAALAAERASRRWSLRDLAGAAGVSLSSTSTALSGSAWPRWPTLTALAGALDQVLVLDNEPGDVVAGMLARLDAVGEFSGRSVAPEAGLRPNTIYDLRKAGRAPSSATVFGLAAWLDAPIRARARAAGVSEAVSQTSVLDGAIRATQR